METYISQQKKQLLDSLENQVRFSQLVAVIVGEIGIGKTFLIQQLQQRLEDEISIASIDASLAMTEDQLEKTISLQLGLHWQESEVSLEQQVQNDLQQKVLISIDDAQLLSASCLDFILQLNQKQLQLQESVLFILLSGDISLPSLINETSTFKQHQEMCVVFQIEPIQQHETKAMVTDLCQHRSEWLDDLYEDKKLIYFWQLSNGNPAELNYHLSRWLEENSKSEIVEIKTDEKTSYVRSVFYVVIAGALVATLFYQSDINHWIASGNEGDHVIDKKSIEVEQRLSSNDSSMVNNKIVSNVNPTNKEPQVETDTTIDEYQPPKSSLEPETDVSEIGEDNTKSTAVENTVSEDHAKNEKTTTELAEELPPAKGKNLTNLVGTDTSSNLSTDEESLLKLDGRLFVLQWVGLSSMQAAEDYRNNHPLTHKMVIYRRDNGSQLLYLVISDQFLSRMLGDVAKAEYKKRGYPGKPWVKSVAAVKKEIEALSDLSTR